MLEDKSLFNASFEESKKISPNLFQKKPLSYNLGAADSSEFTPLIGLIAFSVMMYGFGVFLPNDLVENPPSAADIHFISVDIYKGIAYFTFISPILIAGISAWILIAVLNLFPKKNYMVQRIFGVLYMLCMILLMDFSIMPMMLGITLGAVGWLGFTFITLYGVIFLVIALRNRSEKIKQELYKGYEIRSNWLDSLWQVLRRIWVIPAIVMFLNVLTFRIGMWGNFSLWSFPWLFAGLLYFGLVTAFSIATMKMFVTSYYFWKYAEQYRELWKVTDEQWYGKRKAQKNVKKKLKQKKKEEIK